MTLPEFFSLLGGVGMFLYGMSIMSIGLKEAAGNRLRSILEKATANRFAAVAVGILVTLLIQNAIQYNRENGTILVSCGQENGHPFFSVRDSGIGIPENQQQRIFERFYRVDKSRSRQTGGTGLGLAIVKHIAEIHDAKIILDSEPGEGTCITVRF